MGLLWERQYVLSHGSNVSARVAVLVSARLRVTNMKLCELEQGRVLIVQVSIKNVGFMFVNVYAPSCGVDHLRLCQKIRYLKAA